MSTGGQDPFLWSAAENHRLDFVEQLGNNLGLVDECTTFRTCLGTEADELLEIFRRPNLCKLAVNVHPCYKL